MVFNCGNWSPPRYYDFMGFRDMKTRYVAYQGGAPVDSQAHPPQAATQPPVDPTQVSLDPESPADSNQAGVRSVSPSEGVSQGPSPGETKLGPKARRNEERAVSEAAGARLVFTASADAAPGTNPRTCLLRAILAFTQ